MKSALLSIFLVLIAESSCTRKNDPKNQAQPTGPDQTIRLVKMKHIGFNIIELDFVDSVEIKLETIDPLDAETKFSLECDDPRCKQAVQLGSDGILKWDGPKFIPAINTGLKLKIRTTRAGHDRPSEEIYNLTLEIRNYLYQAGDQWTFADSSAPDLTRFAKIIGIDSNQEGHRGATVFYLGRFGGEDLIATAKHVFESQKTGQVPNCSEKRIFRFESLGFTASCKKIVWTSEQNDFIVLAIESKNDNGLADLRASSICPISVLQESLGNRVALGGYGRYRNPYSYLKFTADEDCRVLSNYRHDFGSARSPSILNVYPVIACDGSPGVSGAPLFDRDSGKILGVALGQNNYLNSRVSSKVIQDFIASKEVDSKMIGQVVYLTLFDAISEIRMHIEATTESDPVLNDLVDSFGTKDFGGGCSQLVSNEIPIVP